MKCPGCNFVCSELRDICPKCILDLRPFKAANGLTVTDPTATIEELVARVKGKNPNASRASSPSHSILGGVLSAISQALSGTPTDIPKKYQAPSSEPQPPTNPHSSSEILHESLERTEDEHSRVSSESETSIDDDSITALVFTEDIFPSCASAAGPNSQVVEWIIPAAPREEESTLLLESTTSPQPQEEESTDLQTLAGEIEVEPPTTHSSIFNYSSEEQNILPDTPRDYENPQVMSVEGDHLEPSIEEQDDPPNVQDSSVVENLTEVQVESKITYTETTELTPLPWDGDTDSVEEAFGEAFGDIRSFAASSTIHTDHLFQHSAIDTEQILLHFSLALDELEGRLKVEKVPDVATSDNRQVETAVIDSALQEVQTFLNKADQPAPLKEFIQETLADGAHHNHSFAKKDHVGFSLRGMAISIDVITTFFTCLLLTSLLERGGLTELLADLSVNGFRIRHYHWFIATLALVPLAFVLYHFVTFPFLHATLGERVVGISVRGKNGRPIKARHITSRALSAPLATVLGSPFFVLMGKPALLDYLSGTEIHHINSET
jgi:hypothetical protein